jgi:hypothetical protein
MPDTGCWILDVVHFLSTKFSDSSLAEFNDDIKRRAGY